MIEISETAARKIQSLMAKQGIDDGGLRVGIKGGGCSGLSYTFAWERQPRLGDEVFEGHGAKMEQFCRSRAIGYARCVTSTPFQDTIVHMLRRGKLLQ